MPCEIRNEFRASFIFSAVNAIPQFEIIFLAVVSATALSSTHFVSDLFPTLRSPLLAGFRKMQLLPERLSSFLATTIDVLAWITSCRLPNVLKLSLHTPTCTFSVVVFLVRAATMAIHSPCYACT
uniref:Uncharacterized protein n=1 Tax=Trichuris muris TaxID=70415 RepID=A0A5S6PZE6_TRIMR